MDWPARIHGRVEVDEIPYDPAWERQGIRQKHRYTWHPPFQVASRLPDGFQLDFECSVGDDSIRRFAPLPALDSFLPWAGLAGHRLLDDQALIGKTLLSLDEFWLFSSFVKHLRGYIGPTPQLAQALNIAGKGRFTRARDDADILPATLGLDVLGNNNRWTLSEFRDHGRDAAQAAGIANPTVDDVLVYALFRSAQLNPLRVEPGKERGLVEAVLFTEGRFASIGDEALEFVAGEIKQELQRHLVDTTEQFNAWARDSKGDVVRRIAKLRDCPLEREGVRNALLHLGMEALHAHGNCVDATMRAFEAALPEPLSAAEAELFHLIWRKHAYFGNLPFIVLKDRFAFCKPAVLKLWSNPRDERTRGVFYQMLNYFAEIHQKRRDGWKSYKRESSNGPLGIRNSNQEVVKEQLQPLIESRLNVDLEFCEWEFDFQDKGHKTITLHVYCPRENVDQTLQFSTEELERALKDE